MLDKFAFGYESWIVFFTWVMADFSTFLVRLGRRGYVAGGLTTIRLDAHWNLQLPVRVGDMRGTYFCSYH